MSSEAAKKYDTSKREEAIFYEMEVRKEKERIIKDHEERREKYLKYLAERREERRLRVWQKAFLGLIALSFSFCMVLLLCSFHPSGKVWVHEFLYQVLSLKL